MKLIHFRRLGLFCFAAGLAFTPGCSGGDDDDDDDDDSCETDDDCRGSRFCDDGECRSGGLLSGGTGGGDGSGGTGNNPGKGGTGGSTGGSSATGGTSSGKGGAGGAGGTTGGGPSTGGTGATGGTAGSTAECLDSDAPVCASSDEMLLCDGGLLESYTCSEVCPEIGLAAVDCVEGDGCCGEALDQACLEGVIVYCQCSGNCATEADVVDLYVSCFLEEIPENTEVFHCLADYPIEDPEADCPAAEVCLPAEEPDEPAPEAP